MCRRVVFGVQFVCMTTRGGVGGGLDWCLGRRRGRNKRQVAATEDLDACMEDYR